MNSVMKKPLLIVVIILAIILVLPVISLLRWTFQSKKPMDIIIVDKTVPTLEREKHKSFNWVITNDRFVKKEKKTSYSYRKDYFGFFPTRPLKERLWDQKNLRLVDILGDLGKKTDAVYFTDTYGVFFNDWIQALNKSRKSRRLYGGLNTNDNVLLKTMKDSNKLVILEYNAFDYPTDELNSYRIQERLGITYSGWTGKYFSSLDTAAKVNKDFPIWMTSMYRKQYKKPWTFTKPGVVILRDKYIVVLEEGTTLTKALPEILTDSASCAKYNLPESVPFDHWFDIIDPLGNKVISKFKIGTSSLGDSLLVEYGLTNEFPAAIQDSVGQRTYYFSGDFTHTNIPAWTARFKGIDKLKGILYSKKPDDTRRFFWLYYKPLIKGIFNDYYNSLPK
jgi:hypothetical protein